VATSARRLTLLFGVLTACAPWARGPQLSPAASGLVGEWVAPQKQQLADTTVLRFGRSGSADQLLLGPGHPPRRIPYGPFRVYGDTGRVRLLCFSFRRSRAQPACRYFQVDTLIDGSGRIRRQLHLLNWVFESTTPPESWTERRP